MRGLSGCVIGMSLVALVAAGCGDGGPAGGDAADGGRDTQASVEHAVEVVADASDAATSGDDAVADDGGGAATDATEIAVSDGPGPDDRPDVADALDSPDAPDVPDSAATDADAAVDGPAPSFFLSGRYDHVTRWVADVDGDGNVDLVDYGVSKNVATVLVWRGHGDGTFEASPVTTSFSTYLSQGDGELTLGWIANLDGDGRADFVMMDNQALPADAPGLGNRLRHFRLFGKADSTFELRMQADPSVDGSFQLIGIADFTSDGRDDLLFAGATPVTLPQGFKELLLSYEGPKAQEVSRSQSIGAACCRGSTVIERGIGDIDGDGKLDYAGRTYYSVWAGEGNWREFESSQWWRGLGDGTFGVATPLPDFETRIQDLDLDGKAEIVSQAGVSWNLGGGKFSAPTLPLPGTLGDLNGDGKLDFWNRLSYGDVIQPNWPLLGTPGDFNGDGKLDFWSWTGNGYAVSFGEGPRTWAAPSPRPVRADFAGDYDKDGAADIILAEPTGPTSVYLSTLKGARPRVPDVRCEPTPARCAAFPGRPDSF